MRIKLTWILFLLVIFVPFEVIILKYLPVSDTIYSYLRFFVEIMIYIVAGILFARYLYHHKLPKGTPVDKPVLIFIAYAIVITIVNNAPLLQSFIGLRALLRYVPLFYILSFISLEGKFVRMTFNAIVIIATIQCAVAIYQHYFGISPFWYPRASDLEIGGKQVGFKLLASGFGSGREMGAGIGTFGDSVFLALFLVIAFVMTVAALQKPVQLPKRDKLLISILAGLVLIALFFTYSRGSVLVALAGIPLVIFLAGGRKKLVIYLLAAALLISPVIIFGVMEKSPATASYVNPKIKYTDPLANITAVFSSSYLNNTMQFSRGAVITEIGGNLLSSFKLLGYSPAQEFALEKAATKLFGSNMPINNLPIINDVYWVAFIIYYGIIGLAIYLFIMFKLFQASRFVIKHTPNPYFRIFALTLAAIVIIAIPYSLILRTFVFRSFGFYFWLIAGFVFSEWRRLKQEQQANSMNYPAEGQRSIHSKGLNA